MRPTVMVTGSRGFVGRSLGRAASRNGSDVVGVSRSARPDDDWPGSHHQADVAVDDLADLIGAARPNVIVHAAGSSSVGASFENPVGDLKASVVTWANLLNSIRMSGVDPLAVFVSSAAVYGASDEMPIPEGAPRRPLSPYGSHKAMCELSAEQYSQSFGVRVLVCRLFSLIGPEQRRLLPYEVFAQLVDVSRGEVVLEGSPDATRDYLHVDDATEAILAAAVSVPAEAGSTVYMNLASGQQTRVDELVRLLRDRVADKPVRFLEKVRPGDPARWQADVSVLRDLVPSWSPRDLPTALDQCIASWKE